MHPETSGPKKPKPSDSYLRYSGLGVQLLLTIGAGAWLGHWIDQQLELRFPAFLLMLTFLTFGGSLYQIYNTISKS